MERVKWISSKLDLSFRAKTLEAPTLIETIDRSEFASERKSGSSSECWGVDDSGPCKFKFALLKSGVKFAVAKLACWQSVGWHFITWLVGGLVVVVEIALSNSSNRNFGISCGA